MTIKRPKLFIFNLGLGFLLAGALTSGGLIAYPRSLVVKWPVPSVPALQDRYKKAWVDADRVLDGSQCEQWRDLVAKKAAQYGVDAATIASIIVTESSCNPLAISHADAIGLMGIHLNTWAKEMDWTANNPFDPERNVDMGVRIYLTLHLKYDKYEALRRYYGVTAGSTKSHEYAARVAQGAAR